MTARHDVGQLGVVGGVVAGSTPTSESVAAAPMGSARVSATPARSAASDVRRMVGLEGSRLSLERSILGIEHTENGYVAVRYGPPSSCAAAAISPASPAAGAHGSRSGSPA